MPRPSLPAAALLVLLALPAGHATPQALQLPELGDHSSALVSAREEQQLGQAWLQVFRSQAPLVDDPLLQDYLENLLYDLASHSPLANPRLSLVIIDNKAINAFAVPGGVVGVHNGLLLQAAHEDELASVLAHELAHLSQRHFVRSLEAAQRQQLPAMAGLLAGIILAATAGPDAGMAAIAATQAATLHSQLRYSRQHEQEADRIGMQTLFDAERDPFAFARMFETLQRSSRFAGTRPPEFLLTHPVTESRIADARGRAAQLSGRMTSPTARAGDSDYQLMRARVRLHFAENPSQAVRDARAMLNAPGAQPQEADHYALALALLAAGQPSEAATRLAPLRAAAPGRLPFVLLQADIDQAAGAHDQARQLLEAQLALNPGNHPLVMAYSHLLQQQGQLAAALQVLQAHSYRRPQDPAVWYRLAELHGLAGQILELHQARAEYFILNGRLDEADKQLLYALRLATGQHMATAVIQQRQQDVAGMRNVLKSLQ